MWFRVVAAKNLAINTKSFLFRYVRRKTLTTSLRKRDESRLKAVKRVLCRRQAVTHRHTCELAHKGFSREIRRKRLPVRKMLREPLHICALSRIPFTFFASKTHLNVPLLVSRHTTRLSHVRSSVDGFTTVQKTQA